MKMKLSHIILLLFFCANASAQKATITFTTDKDCEINIYEPIDGEYNIKETSSVLKVHKGQYATYKTNIASYIFVHCQFSQYQKSCDIILFPQTSIKVFVNEKDIKFEGDNCTGQQYFYDKFQNDSPLENYQKEQNLFKEYIEQKREWQSIPQAIDSALHIPFHIKEIEKLSLISNTTPQFANVLKTQVYLSIYSNIIGFIEYLLDIKNDYEHIANDTVEIKKMADCIFKKYPLKPEYQKYSSILYTLKYISYHYKDKVCPAGYDPSTFGPYKMYLYAPIEMQPGLLGGACMTQLKYDSGEMDLKKLKKFFNDKFPQSEYTSIINEKVKEETEPANEILDNSHFIKHPIDSLSQLSDIQELKGKYLLIDLWASWCMPCRAEFGNKDKLEELLNTYKNISTIYISIDNEKQEKAWINCIKYYKLEGFHLRATPALQENIKKEIYKKEQFEIPRYILIGPKGSILNRNLPRPSEYPQLKEALDRIIYEN